MFKPREIRTFIQQGVCFGPLYVRKAVNAPQRNTLAFSLSQFQIDFHQQCWFTNKGNNFHDPTLLMSCSCDSSTRQICVLKYHVCRLLITNINTCSSTFAASLEKYMLHNTLCHSCLICLWLLHFG